MKKAQVTIFIVIGLLLLIAVGISLYFSQIFFTFPGVAQEIKPVATYITQCVEEVTLQGITLAGLQGGYLEIPQELAYDPEGHVDIGLKVPHWYHNEENTGPSLNLIEEQLTTYIKKDLNKCFDDFNALKPQFRFDELPEMRVTTKISDNKIIIKLNFPIKVYSGDTEQTRLNWQPPYIPHEASFLG